jgi:hypothetical protein
MFSRKSALLASVGVALLLSSCSEERTLPGKLATYPVKGQVLVNGGPGDGINVHLHPKTPLKAGEGGVVPTPAGGVDKDGNVSFTTYEPGDGVPAGEYTVTLTKKPVGFGGLRLGGEKPREPDRLGDKYADPAKSEYKLTVTEAGGDLGKIELEVDPAVWSGEKKE